MPVSYNKLFHLLIDMGMKKGELQKEANITASIMARLARNETVRTDTIGKICKALNCQPGDIMEYVEIEELQDDQHVIIRKPLLIDDDVEILSSRENAEINRLI